MPRIASIETFAVAYPLRGRFKFLPAVPNLPAGRRTIVVRLTDDSGLSGWGQAVPSPSWSYETPESVRSTVDLYFAPRLRGLYVDDDAEVRRILDSAIAPSFSRGMPIAKAAVDLSLWDLRGRIAGRSAGAVVAEHFSTSLPPAPVELSWTVNVRELSELDDEVASARSRGYRHFNVKVAPDPMRDLELCRRLRTLAPEAFLWADANGGYDLASALVAAPRLADLGFAALEQPLPANRLGDCRRLRATKAIPILLDEPIIGVTEFDEFRALGLLDGVAVKVSRMGGLTEALRLVRRLRDTESLYFASGLTDPDLSLAASLHLFAGTGLASPAALNGPQFLSGSILRTPLVPDEDRLMPPGGPGLGVEVDLDELAKLQESDGKS